MAENPNRKLRTRKPPAYLLGDNSDPELFGYARTNYTKDFVSSAQEINQMAKNLARFVNSANKLLLQKNHVGLSADEPRAKIFGSQGHDDGKKATIHQEAAKRRSHHRNEVGGHMDRTSKQASLKQKIPEWGQGKPAVQLKEDPKNKTLAAKTKKGSEYKAQIPNLNIDNILQQINKQKHASFDLISLKKSHMAATRALQQQQQILNYNPSLREKLQLQQQFQARHQSDRGEKFFKRSTYHIAIAYQIHLNNLKESGKDLQTPMVIDPTYNARKLKGEFEMQHPKGP